MEHENSFDERAFRQLAELTPDALIIHSGGVIRWANEAALALMAAPERAAMVGRPVLDFVAPESLPLVKARIARMTVSGERVPATEETFLRLDGERVPVEVSAAPLGNGVMVVTARDLRPRRKNEDARHAAEARARTFFEATTAAMGLSKRGVHVEVNAAYARLFGYDDPSELVGVPILELIDPLDHAGVREKVGRRARGEEVSERYPVRGRRRDGSPLLIDVHASSYPDADGPMTVVVMRDVTEQKAAEARLTASEARYRDLFRQVPVGVWEEDLVGAKRIIDELRAGGVTNFARHFTQHPEDVARCAVGLQVLSVNAAACQMVGARDESELIANLHRVFIPESLADLGRLLGTLAGGATVATSEGWNGTLDGQRRWVAVRASVVEPDWSRVLVTTSDMTEQWKAREEKLALLEQLRHSEKLEAIGRLAGGVAHDFNNLLAAILSSTEVELAEVAQGSPTHESLSIIREASLRARELVQQILTFGRKDKPKAVPLDISAVVTDALALARAGIPTTATLEVDVPPNLGTVVADRTQVHQVVLNLCANARDAVGPTGHIRVSLARVDGEARVRLRVEDDGQGMDEATRAHLFEPYLTTKAHGHGLGLAVVHGIVSGAGGSIAVTSAPGRGACFDVTLPLVDDATPLPLKAPVSVAASGARVLLVDDQPMVRSALRRLMQSLGYEVTEAVDGQDALERVRAEPERFDLIVSDQTMPRLSGLELARTLLAERPKTRLLLCTGFSETLEEHRALELGVKAVLPKPVDGATLAAAMQRALAA